MKGPRLKSRRVREKRERVITRLEAQLKSGIKTNGKDQGAQLTPTDEKRIKKELATLASRTGK